MKQGQADKDAEILFPEADLTINGEVITVNEIKFTQGLKIGAQIKPMINALADLFNEEEEPEFEDIAAIFAANDQALKQMISLTTGKDLEWIDSLGDSDGQNLMMTVWMVNRDFFTRRVVSKGMAAHLKSRQNQSALEKSSAN